MHIAGKSDFYSSLLILALMGICWKESLNIDQGISFALGPLFFPHLLMGCIILCSLILLIRSIGRGSAPAAGKNAAPDRKTLRYRIILTCLSGAYIFALPYGGYAPCTIVYLLTAMLILGKHDARSMAVYTAVSLGMTFGIQYIFADMLRLFLP